MLFSKLLNNTRLKDFHIVAIFLFKKAIQKRHYVMKIQNEHTCNDIYHITLSN